MKLKKHYQEYDRSSLENLLFKLIEKEKTKCGYELLNFVESTNRSLSFSLDERNFSVQSSRRCAASVIEEIMDDEGIVAK